MACLCVEVLLISVIFSGICTFKLHEFMLWQQTASTKTIPIQKVKILFSQSFHNKNSCQVSIKRGPSNQQLERSQFVYSWDRGIKNNLNFTWLDYLCVTAPSYWRVVKNVLLCYGRTYGGETAQSQRTQLHFEFFWVIVKLICVSESSFQRGQFFL